jgi:hypothetical protein
MLEKSKPASQRDIGNTIHGWTPGEIDDDQLGLGVALVCTALENPWSCVKYHPLEQYSRNGDMSFDLQVNSN